MLVFKRFRRCTCYICLEIVAFMFVSYIPKSGPDCRLFEPLLVTMIHSHMPSVPYCPYCFHEGVLSKLLPHERERIRLGNVSKRGFNFFDSD